MGKFVISDYFSLIRDCCFGVYGSKDYAKAIKILMDCHKRKGTVFTMGCGGSASTAMHFAADLAKTTGGFRALSLVDNTPLVSAYTNDLGWESVFAGQLDDWITKDDVLIGFSVHGGNSKWSGNLTNALNLAKKKGAKIIGFSGFDGGSLMKMSDACFVVPTKSETYGTPVVEAMHVVINHGIIFDLREKIYGKT